MTGVLTGGGYVVRYYEFTLLRPGAEPPVKTVRRFSELRHLWHRVCAEFGEGGNDRGFVQVVRGERDAAAAVEVDSDEGEDDGGGTAPTSPASAACFSSIPQKTVTETARLMEVITEHLLKGRFKEAEEGLAGRIYENKDVREFFGVA